MANTESVEDRFGRRLRAARESVGISQSALAEAMAKVSDGEVRLHPSAVAKIEARDVDSPRAIRLSEAVAAATAVGVDLKRLLEPQLDPAETVTLFIEMAVVHATGIEDRIRRLCEELRQTPAVWEAIEADSDLSAELESFSHPKLQERLFHLGDRLRAILPAVGDQSAEGPRKGLWDAMRDEITESARRDAMKKAADGVDQEAP